MKIRLMSTVLIIATSLLLGACNDETTEKANTGSAITKLIAKSQMESQESVNIPVPILSPKRAKVVRKVKTAKVTEHLLSKIMLNEMFRLNIFEHSWPTFVMKFAKFVKEVESNGDRLAKNPNSTAMSYYQFVEGAVPTGVNRLQNYMTRHNMGQIPTWASALRNNPQGLFSVSLERQTILMLVNIIEQKGSDALLKRFMKGDVTAAKQLYYNFHHTAPDKATVARTELKYALFFSEVN